MGYYRRKTCTITIGGLSMGSEYPVRMQSMTNTPTRQIDESVLQCIRIIEAGGELVRLTVPSITDAVAIKEIVASLREKGYNTPVAADVHFNAKVAEKAAPWVDKVRINPGNFDDKQHLSVAMLSASEYADTLTQLRQKFLPLLQLCQLHNTALRIGVNHGSLSSRIMSRYGDTPEGMAESAMEFVRICHQENFTNVVISMKSSNTRVMAESTRLVVKKMEAENIPYPVHLGVTEAGEGEDGRIKSAIGIGAMLAEGIGDTIRVSLTEDPEKEIPVAKQITAYFEQQNPEKNQVMKPVFPQGYKSNKVSVAGGNQPPLVIAQIHKDFETSPEAPADFYFAESLLEAGLLPADTKLIFPHSLWVKGGGRFSRSFPYFESFESFLAAADTLADINFVAYDLEGNYEVPAQISDYPLVLVAKVNANRNGQSLLADFLNKLQERDVHVPVIFQLYFSVDNSDQVVIDAACTVAPFFINSMGDGIWINPEKIHSTNFSTGLGFGLLQASRMRITRTEFISCPSCGRTNFDLQKTTARIKAVTKHLKNLKIGVMGCIVNGPGEMADADFGYVGSRKGKITLYKGKNVVKKNIPEENAVNELVELIKMSGQWTEPK